MKSPITVDSSKIKKILRPALILALLFLALLALEAYVLYYNVYGNLFTEIEDSSMDVNIVRLDVTNYNKMIELLDSLKDYTPANPAVENPFR